MALINYTEAGIRMLSIHWVGNKGNHEPVFHSDSPYTTEVQDISEKLLHFFLSGFKDETRYMFKPGSAKKANRVQNQISRIRSDFSNFHDASGFIASELYDMSDHPAIKGGECWLVYFQNLIIKDEVSDAIGIFKTDIKDEFIHISKQNTKFDLSVLEGISINKLDKGCLVMNNQDGDGSDIFIIDNINSRSPAEYWKDKFLCVKPVIDPYYNTKNELRILKAFFEKEFDPADKLAATEKLGSGVEYMVQNDSFNLDDFGRKVFPESRLNNSFNNFRQVFQKDYDVEIEDNYEIEHRLLKNPKKFIRSVIKLDKDFHIYIHGKRDNIIRGYDEEKGMNYYKIFFNEEN